ncbi:MAG: alpha/beta hydrolase [Proteobacteria bacterium]|nr:alpha/beta hydrolase [Pseudomonadota bacterium]
MIGFALCHGWSYDARAMAALQAALQQRLPQARYASFDLGYGGQPHHPALSHDVHWIALGHSWGFAWLLQQAQPWRAAISLNGFTRFCRLPSRSEGTPLRLLDAMLARLQTEPDATVQDFRQRCGTLPTPENPLDQALLSAHLTRLCDLDITLPSLPLLALHTSADAIVSPALTHACFHQTGVALQEFSGDHTHLLREPAIAADAIAVFVEALDA